MSYKFYTNGIKTIRVYDDETPPQGFYLGRTFKSNPWNKGLTKDDPRVAENIKGGEKTRFKKGHQSWNKGLTKETNKTLQEIGEKVSQARQGKSSWNKGKKSSLETKLKLSTTRKELYSNGTLKSWNKGLTKQTDDRLMKMSLKALGRPCMVDDWESAKKKEYETKKRNNSFNISKPEKELKLKLIELFGEDNVLSQYRDDRYPFNCDLYIKPLDLFIELNLYWAHNTHPFDEQNLKDLEILNLWKIKSISHKQYEYAIKVWTITDPNKKNIAIKNNLNYLSIYNLSKIEDIIKNLENFVNFWEFL